MPRRGEFGVSPRRAAISGEMKQIDEKVVLGGGYGDEIVSSALMETATRERWYLQGLEADDENGWLPSVTYGLAGH